MTAQVSISLIIKSLPPERPSIGLRTVTVHRGLRSILVVTALILRSIIAKINEGTGYE